MASATEDPSTIFEIHLDDAQLYEQLAKLQHMHKQVHELRDLLPSALIGPLRETATRTRQTSPQQVAYRISKTAQKGRQDIQNFKKDWHDEKTRQLLKDASTSEMEQGADAWLVDYQALLRANKGSKGAAARFDGGSLDTIEDVKTVVEKFNKPESRLKLITNTSDAGPFPMTVETARMSFMFERREDRYEVAAISKDQLAMEIAKQVQQSGKRQKIDTLLVSMSAIW